ncbi:MAG: protein kinase [Waddliaceae bacterium]
MSIGPRPSNPVSYEQVSFHDARKVLEGHEAPLHPSQGNASKMVKTAEKTADVAELYLVRIAKGVEKGFYEARILEEVESRDVTIGKERVKEYYITENGKERRVYPVTKQTVIGTLGKLEYEDLMKRVKNGEKIGFLMPLKKSKIESVEKEMRKKEDIKTKVRECIIKKLKEEIKSDLEKEFRKDSPEYTKAIKELFVEGVIEKRYKEVIEERYQEAIKHLDLEASDTSLVVEGQVGELRKVELASHGNLESFLNKKFPLDTEKATDLCRQLEKARQTLKDVGYVHGDLKLDNVLVFEDSDKNLVLKVTDFGKSKHVDELNTWKAKIHKGNLRNCAPEMENSIEGDAYSFASLMVQILEASIVTKEGKREKLIKPIRDKTILSANEAHEERSPFIKYLCAHKNGLAIDAKHQAKDEKAWYKTMRASFVRMKTVMGLHSRRKHIECVHVYIDALHEELKREISNALTIKNLLKTMTALNPEDRLGDDFKRYSKEFAPPKAKDEIPLPPFFAPPPPRVKLKRSEKPSQPVQKNSFKLKLPTPGQKLD